MRELVHLVVLTAAVGCAPSLAVNLAFFELAQAEPDARVSALADAKLPLDMQSIVAMREASSG
jgi:hypothetical protein